jgi:hypothetical protein
LRIGRWKGNPGNPFAPGVALLAGAIFECAGEIQGTKVPGEGLLADAGFTTISLIFMLGLLCQMEGPLVIHGGL